MKSSLRINFDPPVLFSMPNIRPLSGIIGLYFIFLKNKRIAYPFHDSRLLYIGMSERKTNSIGRRLASHWNGTSENPGLLNYRKRESLLFTHINFEMLKIFWDQSIENLESYFILDFVEKFGVYPICNNKTKYDVINRDRSVDFEINWECFN